MESEEDEIKAKQASKRGRTLQLYPQTSFGELKNETHSNDIKNISGNMRRTSQIRVTRKDSFQKASLCRLLTKYDAIHTVTELWWAHAHLEVLYAVRELGLPHPGFSVLF